MPLPTRNICRIFWFSGHFHMLECTICSLQSDHASHVTSKVPWDLRPSVTRTPLSFVPLLRSRRRRRLCWCFLRRPEVALDLRCAHHGSKQLIYPRAKVMREASIIIEGANPARQMKARGAFLNHPKVPTSMLVHFVFQRNLRRDHLGCGDPQH
jgi:hypothetical protein